MGMAGFCVLEMLLAAFLAAVALGGAVQLIGTAARAHDLARDRWVRSVEAWNKSEDLRSALSSEADTTVFPLDRCPGLRRWEVEDEPWEVWKSEIGRFHAD